MTSRQNESGSCYLRTSLYAIEMLVSWLSFVLMFHEPKYSLHNVSMFSF